MSKKIKGIPYPTKNAIFLLTEAFELDKSTDPYKKFTRPTRMFLAKKYNCSHKLFIFDTKEIGMRLNGEGDLCNKIARDIAFAAYQACNAITNQ